MTRCTTCVFMMYKAMLYVWLRDINLRSRKYPNRVIAFELMMKIENRSKLEVAFDKPNDGVIICLKLKAHVYFASSSKNIQCENILIKDLFECDNEYFYVGILPTNPIAFTQIYGRLSS